MLEEQLEVIIVIAEVEQTASVYQSNHSTLPTLLGCRADEHTCMGLSMRPQVLGIMVHFALSMNIIYHVQFAILQHEELL